MFKIELNSDVFLVTHYSLLTSNDYLQKFVKQSSKLEHHCLSKASRLPSNNEVRPLSEKSHASKTLITRHKNDIFSSDKRGIVHKILNHDIPHLLQVRYSEFRVKNCL